MAEEFQESDIIFSDHHYHNHHDFSGEFFDFREMRDGRTRNNRDDNNKKAKKNKKYSRSVPVNIPGNGGIFQYGGDSDDSEQEYDGDGEMVPPHEIIGRRIAGQMAFSVCTGNGRTLKGRDLSQVRNTVLRMTGFLET